MSPSRQLWWLRNDLRCADNPALNAALARGPVLACFVISPAQWQAHDDAACKVDFWLRSLRELSRELAALNIPLKLIHCPLWADVPQALSAFCAEHNIAAVHSNAEYAVNERQRDQACAQALAKQGISWHAEHGNVLAAPGSVLTNSDTVFKVYSQFRKRLLAQWSLSGSPCPSPYPKAQAALTMSADAIPPTVNGFATPTAELQALWPAGTDAALARLRAFADSALLDYKTQRDLPALPGTSQLSPYLAAGVVSLRQCLYSAQMANDGQLADGNDGAVQWINELLWREFYLHILAGYPRVSRHRAFRPETELVAWRHAPEDLAAWQQGRTGIPIVDAAMRQLLATGWMHNRLRMVSAMFLTKNLLIDWRAGERWFMQHLIDGDLAANNGGWQWSASTGTDAAPYFRVFNPVSQSQRNDPDGHFIRHWLPELSSLDARSIHQPSSGLFGVDHYPAPIVDLSSSRQRAIAAFKNLPKAQEIA
ncbi:deoxyribodipyrimidine photo-lyase [Atopomonas sediminilitoris]|uniref:deoxyribodipyrimidine photo-lyase n=1 Tax=Atopomonas sediminilitoris TaxID=2919919 RepID=UPI001F4E091D|nr:deoxyribodipyrimidine photo-lyase [Atopomonas sediminilitoris]MCJ8168090.1 deoxyribodipyrimidine photo-lyase [Atopomonas sediminilitoris]